MTNFECKDAILEHAAGPPSEPVWPAAEFIVSNPPFLGDKMMRAVCGDEYVDRLRAALRRARAKGADLCCYWFEKARAQIVAGECRRAGLLATQGIRAAEP